MPEGQETRLEFIDATVGINIPKNFIPSIEKVIQSANLAVASIGIFKDAVLIQTYFLF